jgi:hypothetical protein
MVKRVRTRCVWALMVLAAIEAAQARQSVPASALTSGTAVSVRVLRRDDTVASQAAVTGVKARDYPASVAKLLESLEEVSARRDIPVPRR